MRGHLLVGLLLLPAPGPALAQGGQPCEVPQQKKTRGLGGMLSGLGSSLIDKGMRAAGVADQTQVRSSMSEMLTNFIACRLDEGERRRAAAATARALETPVGQTIGWESETRAGVKGSSTATAQSRLADGTVCREVRDVATIDGEEQTVTKTMCRAPGAAGYTMRPGAA